MLSRVRAARGQSHAQMPRAPVASLVLEPRAPVATGGGSVAKRKPRVAGLAALILSLTALRKSDAPGPAHFPAATNSSAAFEGVAKLSANRRTRAAGTKPSALPGWGGRGVRRACAVALAAGSRRVEAARG